MAALFLAASPPHSCVTHHRFPHFAAPRAPSARFIRTGCPRLAAAGGNRRCDLFDLHKQIVPYARSLAWQEYFFWRKKQSFDMGEDHSDTLIALQHAPAYTLGRSTDLEQDLLFDPDDPPCEVHRVGRGGKATYHGPGQLVLYPILNLRCQDMDLDSYHRSLEQVIIRALKSAFSIEAYRVPKLTGVWVGDQKVAAIGIQGCSKRSLVYHGLALNVTTDLTPFKMIVPCGIKDRGVGSVKEILRKASGGTSEVDDTVLMDRAYDSLIKEFAELFNLEVEVDT